MNSETKCFFCSGNLVNWGTATVLNKHQAVYLKCEKCGYIKPEKTHWLAEAYSSAITTSDTGLLSRNLDLLIRLLPLFKVLYPKGGRFLDYGAGYGVFPRLMRDRGYEFHSYDTYCKNIFSGDLVVDKLEQRFEAVTAFEVFEHWLNPIEELDKIAKVTDTIIFSTCLRPDSVKTPADWWYFGLEHGQHVSLYTKKSLASLGAHYGMKLVSRGNYLHILTRKPITNIKFKFLTNRKLGLATMMERNVGLAISKCMQSHQR
jgi:hypothetical protein